MRKKGFVTVVSGIPRSGTSMMMGMLVAGGLRGGCSFDRAADEHNPFGYYECEWVKDLGEKPEAIRFARGKCVKVVSELVGFLPEGERYKMVFMLRDLADVVSSQFSMAGNPIGVGWEELVGVFGRHLLVARDYIGSRTDISCIYVGFEDVLRDPLRWALKVSDFLGLGLNVEAMANSVVIGESSVCKKRYCEELGPLSGVDVDIRERVLRSLGYL